LYLLRLLGLPGDNRAFFRRAGGFLLFLGLLSLPALVLSLGEEGRAGLGEGGWLRRLPESLILLPRLGLLFLAAEVFQRRVKAGGVRDLSAWTAARIPGLDPERVGLVVGLVFRFLPDLEEMYRSVREAGELRSGGRRAGPGDLARRLLPFFILALDRARTLGDALLCRGFDLLPGGQPGPSEEWLPPYRRRDAGQLALRGLLLLPLFLPASLFP
jgi:hypothetical protein